MQDFHNQHGSYILQRSALYLTKTNIFNFLGVILMNNESLLIIDGMGLLFQMFYGMPARIIGKNGKPVQGVLGFIAAMLKTMRRLKPTHTLVIFDGETHNERKDIDAEYKANRIDYSQMEEDDVPFTQLPYVYEALKLLGIPHFETTDCEADDSIATYAINCSQTMPVTICSFDSDFFQLINKEVSVYRYRGDKSVVCDEAYIKEKLNIKPCQYADYKSLVGDTADNIKGARGVGPKTAAELLNQFQTLENVLENVENIKKPAIKATILNNIDKLRTNYRLIKLTNCACMPYKIEQLTTDLPKLSSNEIMKKINLF